MTVTPLMQRSEHEQPTPCQLPAGALEVNFWVMSQIDSESLTGSFCSSAISIALVASHCTAAGLALNSDSSEVLSYPWGYSAVS